MKPFYLFSLLVLAFCLLMEVPLVAQPGLLEEPVGFTLPPSPLATALQSLESAIPYTLSYNPNIIPPRHRVQVQNPTQSIGKTLDQWLAGAQLAYRVVGTQIVVYPLAEKSSARTEPPRSKRTTLAGYVRDAVTGEALIGATVYTRKGVGVRTNAAGFFSLKIPPEKLFLYARYVGYEPDTLLVDGRRDSLITFTLTSNMAMDSVRIIARQINDDRMGAIRIDVAQIEDLPALGGEPDVIRAAQMLPGVKFGNEGTSGLFVRGGTPDQNLILLDGVPIYNASHLFGFTSIFHPYGLKQVELYKGGFPARYGGRLSSVLDIRTREGSREAFKGQGRIGIVSSNLMVEGPLAKGRGSYLISARRSLYELATLPVQWYQQLQQEGNYSRYHFGDINAKITYRSSEKDEWTLSAYTGQDRLRLIDFIKVDTLSDQQENYVQWGNRIVSASWNRLWSTRLFSQLTTYYSRYRLLVGYDLETIERPSGTDEQTSELGLRYRSGVEDVGAKWDFSFAASPRHQIKFGIQGVRHSFLPGALEAQAQVNGLVDSSFLLPPVQVLPALEGRAYWEDNIQLNRALQLNLGLHASAFRVQGQTYTSLEPRLLLQWRPTDNLTFSASYSRMQQYLHLLSNSGLGLPIDLWVPPTPDIPPQRAWQTSAGMAWQIAKGFYLTLDGYYKEMRGLIDYREGSSFLLEGNDWTQQVAIGGEGKSYGAELLLRKDLGRWRGWLGYTWAKTDRQFDEINEGRRYPFRYDRRHEASLVLRYVLSERVELNFNWVYATGNAFTMPQAVYASNLYPEQSGLNLIRFRASFLDVINLSSYVPRSGIRREVEIFDYGDRNSSRMPAYHRMDVGISWRKPTAKGERVWRFSIYNVYNRINPYFIQYSQDGVPGSDFLVVQGRFEKVGLLPLLPALSYQFNF